MTAYVNAMTYYWHEMGSLPRGGEHNKSTTPAPPSRKERMPESTIVCNMYKRQCLTSARCTGRHTHTHIYIIYIYNTAVMTSACGCTAVIPDAVEFSGTHELLV